MPDIIQYSSFLINLTDCLHFTESYSHNSASWKKITFSLITTQNLPEMLHQKLTVANGFPLIVKACVSLSYSHIYMTLF